MRLSAETSQGSVETTALQQRLEYVFSNFALLEQALTHASVRSGEVGPNNERLEFLGDRVLGLAMAELIYEVHPADSEGDLARRFNGLVKRDTCAEVAREWRLGDCIKLGIGERGGAHAKDTILADACEAVLAAVFLDGGFDAARALVRRSFAHRTGGPGKVAMDAKTMLQEWAQGRDLKLPQYAETDRSGPAHAPRFITEVRVTGLEPAAGEGSNKRAAEQAAARALLVREGVWSDHDG
jgi:ribonuclease III